MYKKGTGNDKQGKEAGNRKLCPYRNFSQAIMTNTTMVETLHLLHFHAKWNSVNLQYPQSKNFIDAQSISSQFCQYENEYELLNKNCKIKGGTPLPLSLQRTSDAVYQIKTFLNVLSSKASRKLGSSNIF